MKSEQNVRQEYEGCSAVEEVSERLGDDLNNSRAMLGEEDKKFR